LLASYVIDSSPVKGVGAIATSSNAANCPPSVSTRAVNECLPAVIEHHHVARLDVRSGMLDGAEIVASGVVEAIDGHPALSIDRSVAKREVG
jgi:hypothetical protein